MMTSRAERLEELYRRLDDFPAAGSAAEAYHLLRVTLDEIEDEHSGTANEPDRWREDGRLYPPQPDRLLKVSPVEGAICYRSVNHRILFGDAGAIGILDGDDVWVYRKRGCDGRMLA